LCGEGLQTVLFRCWWPGGARHPLRGRVQVAVLLLLTKPWGLMGERLAVIPTLRINLRQGALAAVEMPSISVTPVKHADGEASSSIPWFMRLFLQ
jgi:hypothetical protein